MKQDVYEHHCGLGENMLSASSVISDDFVYNVKR